MFTLELDLRDFERAARSFGAAAEQVPFALANTLNDAMRAGREHLIRETWPSHVQQRNTAFIGRALRRKFASKHDLSAEIYDDLGRAHLALHAKGGVKQSRGRLAIPVPGSDPAQARGARGIPKQFQPANLERQYGKRAVRVTPRGIFVGQGGRLRMVYAFKDSAQIKKDVPFVEDAFAVIRGVISQQFPRRLMMAMRTRRR